MEITQNILKEILDYNPETGLFIWKKRISKCIKIGKLAGFLDNRGYIRITIYKKKFSAHRLAWLYVYGKWPNNIIDHINRIKTDNRINNLRDVSDSENKENRSIPSKSNTTGFLGVSKNRWKFRATIRVNKIKINLGTFDTPEEAHQYYLNAKKELHIECQI